jgi:hypothetical protein
VTSFSFLEVFIVTLSARSAVKTIPARRTGAGSVCDIVFFLEVWSPRLRKQRINFIPVLRRHLIRRRDHRTQFL